tara:strand:- start:3890 stop:4348 length:459 start_codon:yes stop_codon:yes gene_type:complete
MTSIDNKRKMKSVSMLAVSTVACAILFQLGCVDEKLKPGSRYIVNQPMYLMAVYDSLDQKEISKETARAYLHAVQYYDKSDVAFQYEVPTGTTVTVLRRAPKVWALPFFANRYFVTLEPDVSRGLDIVLEVDRGIKGEMDGLNSELFGRLSI